MQRSLVRSRARPGDGRARCYGATFTDGVSTSVPDVSLIAAIDRALDDGALAPLRAAVAQADLAAEGDEAADWVILNASMSDHAEAVLETLLAGGLDLVAQVDTGDGSCRRVDRLLAFALGGGVTTPGVIGWLIARGADVNRRVNGDPLVAMCLTRSADVNLALFDALLAGGPDVNAANDEGVTALMRAAARDGDGRPDAIERLLARGADPHRRDRQGRTAADYAAAVPAPHLLQRLPTEGAAMRSSLPFCAAFGLRPGDWCVLEPLGTPVSWRWVTAASDAGDAQRAIETRYGWSRPPIGPFAVLQVVDVGEHARRADAHATRHAGAAMPGRFVLLTLTALAPPDQDADLPPAPRALFVVSGVFNHHADATAALSAPRGYSIIARLQALTVMTDGYPDPAAAMPAG